MPKDAAINARGSQAQKQERIKDPCPAQGDRGAGKRPDQESQGPAAVPAERH